MWKLYQRSANPPSSLHMGDLLLANFYILAHPVRSGSVIKVEVNKLLSSSIAGYCHTLVLCLAVLQPHTHVNNGDLAPQDVVDTGKMVRRLLESAALSGY